MTMSPWLLQESFNTICATTNVVVEVCVGFMSAYPDEQRKTMCGILDLLLHVLTTPQSSVTHLRAVAGALQALEFDVDLSTLREDTFKQCQYLHAEVHDG